MSVEVSHNPRFYTRNECTALRNPPECTCVAVLLERKYIASNRPPPHVDAERLARSITVSSGVLRKVDVCVYRDRLLFHPLSKRSTLPDILFDDIVQIEVLSRKQNILFILCGRRGIGTYYFFKLSDPMTAQKIKELAINVNPRLQYERDGHDSQMPKFLRRTGYDSYPSMESNYDYDSYRKGRDHSTPPSVYSSSSSSSSDEMSHAASKHQNGFIEWSGYKADRSNAFNYPSRSRSNQGKNISITMYPNASRSKSHSPQRTKEKTAYIKAQGGVNRRKATLTSDKRTPLPVMGENKFSSKNADRRKHGHPRDDKRKQRHQGATAINSRKHSKRPIPNKIILTGGSDTDDSSDLANEVTVGRHRYANGTRLKTMDYQRGDLGDYDWESTDSWDLLDDQTLGQFREMSYGASRGHGGRLKNSVYGIDEMPLSSEDSLCLESEEQYGMKFPKRQTNYLPELRQKFRQFNLK